MGSALDDSEVHTRLWDLVVIGGGTAGLVASRTAASFGASVLLVEAHRLGGDCLWTGCVPSKTLIAAAHAAHTARTARVVNATGPEPTVDFDSVMGGIHAAITTISPADSAESLEAAGVAVLHGAARFRDGRSLVVDGRTIRFRQALIATGSRPRALDAAGADSVTVLTNETVWDLRELPQRLAVVGGGAIGCELGQALARLGSRVTLIQRGGHLIPKESAAAEALVSASLESDGVDLRKGRTVRLVGSTDAVSGSVTLDDGAVIEFDRMLVAVGREPDTDALGLKNAGIGSDAHGNVIVDDLLRTTNSRIWAAGDVTGLPQFTHTAGMNGSLAATNAVLGLRRRVERRVVPRVTFTQPEVATVGTQADEADPTKQRVVTIDHAHVDRAITEDATNGFTQIITDRRGVVLGGTIVSPRAGESLAELTLAVKNGLTAAAIAGTTHPYPTYNDAVWNASLVIVRERLGRGVVRHAIRALAAVRRVRMR